MTDTYYLDLGNSRWKYFQDDTVLAFSYKKDPVAGMVEILETMNLPARFVIASVRNEAVNRGLEKFLITRKCSLRWITWEDCRTLQTAYEDPAKLGVDRYLNMLAVKQYYSLPAIVISAGTAVTVDALDDSGVHLGGVIFPGKRLLMQSLALETDKINVDSTHRSDTIFARNTQTGVAAGVSLGLRAAVEGIAKMMASKLEGEISIVLTGGDADCLAKVEFGNKTITDETLLFKGLHTLDRK